MEVSRKRAESPTSLKLGGKIPKLDINMATENIKNTLVDVGQQFDRWCELMVIIGAITHEAFALDLLNWFERCPKLSAARREKGILPPDKTDDCDIGENVPCDKSDVQSATEQPSSHSDQRSEEPYKITLNDSCSSSPVTPAFSPSTSQDVPATEKEPTENETEEKEKKDDTDMSHSQSAFPVMVMAVPGANEAVTADPSTTVQYTSQNNPDGNSRAADCDSLEMSTDACVFQNDGSVNQRRKWLCMKCSEMVNICGGEIFFQYRDCSGSRWTYASSENMWKWYLNCDGGHDDNWLDEQGCVKQSITYTSCQKKTVSLLGRNSKTKSILDSDLSCQTKKIITINKPMPGKVLSAPRIITVRNRQASRSAKSSVPVKKIIITKKILSSHGQTGTMLMSIVNTDSGMSQTSKGNSKVKTASGKDSTGDDSDSDEPVIEKVEFPSADNGRITPITIQSDSDEEEENNVSKNECVKFSEDENSKERSCEICCEKSTADPEGQNGWWVRCKRCCSVWVHSKCIGWTEKMVGSQTYLCTECLESEESAIVL